jgi:hypothetical protein
MDLIAAITSEDLPALLREHPELAAARDEKGVSALLLSLYHRRPDARDALLAAGAPVGPLEAAALGDVAALEGADLSVRGGDGFTPLHLAAFFGGVEAVEAILAAGAGELVGPAAAAQRVAGGVAGERVVQPGPGQVLDVGEDRVALGVAVVGAAYPAWRALRLAPVEALRRQ